MVLYLWLLSLGFDLMKKTLREGDGDVTQDFTRVGLTISDASRKKISLYDKSGGENVELRALIIGALTRLFGASSNRIVYRLDGFDETRALHKFLVRKRSDSGVFWHSSRNIIAFFLVI